MIRLYIRNAVLLTAVVAVAYGLTAEFGPWPAVRTCAAVSAVACVTGAILLRTSGVGRVTWRNLPLTLYKLFPSEKRKRRFFTPLFTTWDDDWADSMGDAFRDFVLDLRIPPVATDAQLKGLTMPTLVIGAAHDVWFPGEKLLNRVKAVVPNVETELLADSKHSPPFTPEFRRWLAARVTRFLGGVAGGLPASSGTGGG
jgi:pimeloyl-ACP methyl ester carboxylesterase